MKEGSSYAWIDEPPCHHRGVVRGPCGGGWRRSAVGRLHHVWHGRALVVRLCRASSGDADGVARCPATDRCTGEVHGRPSGLKCDEIRVARVVDESKGLNVDTKRRSRKISEGPQTEDASSRASPRNDEGAPCTAARARRCPRRGGRAVMTAPRLAFCPGAE